ncbi:MAG TPA: HAMP domain-containing sensor histidine kinase [Polyangiaceae bacterium]|nr:HAMP domain-containing sensor histidine kinase [Polyangiaceae bacterium]
MKLSTRLALFFALGVMAVVGALAFVNYRSAAQFFVRMQSEELELTAESLTRAAQALAGQAQAEQPRAEQPRAERNDSDAARAFLRAEDEARARLTVEFEEPRAAAAVGVGLEQLRFDSEELVLALTKELRSPDGRVTAVRFIRRSPGWSHLAEQQLYQQLGIGSLIVIAASFGLRLLLQRHLDRPLAGLAQLAEDAGVGVLNKRAELGNAPEIDKLGASLNHMLDGVVAARDAAARQDLERIRLLEVLRRGDRERTVDYLAAEFAHELGSPLNVVHGRASMLLDGGGGGVSPSELGGQILQQVERMSSLIRRRVGRHRPVRVRQPVAEVVYQAELLLEPILTDRGVELSFVSEPEIVAYFDTERLLQVVTSLILTSVRTSQPRSRVEMSLTRIVAQDSVPPQVEPGRFALLRITNPDPEPDPSLLKELGSVDEGLGLSYRLCEDIVQSLGGFIEFQSAAGDGTSFSVFLPKTVANASQP